MQILLVSEWANLLNFLRKWTQFLSIICLLIFAVYVFELHKESTWATINRFASG